MPKPTHIIHQQVFDLTLPQQRGAFELQTAISQQYQQKVLPLLSNYLDELVPADQVLRVDRLEVDLGTISLQDFDVRLLAAIKTALEPKMVALKERDEAHFNVVQRSTPDAWAEVLQYFLKTGTLPWWSKTAETKNLEATLFEHMPNWSAPFRAGIKAQLQKAAALDTVLMNHLTGPQTAAYLAQQVNTRQSLELRRLAAQFTDSWIALLIQQIYSLSVEEFEKKQKTAEFFVQQYFAKDSQKARKMSLLLLLNLIDQHDLAQRIHYLLAMPKVNSAATTSVPQQISPVQIGNSASAEGEKTLDDSEANPWSDSPKTPISSKEQVDEQPQAVLQPEPTAAIPATTGPMNVEKQLAQHPNLDSPNAESRSSPEHPLSTTPEPGSSAEHPLITTAEPGMSSKHLLSTIPEPVPSPEHLMSTIPEPGLTAGVYYIENAGLVLLAPYLGDFLQVTGLLTQRNFKDEAAQQRAIHLLQFLATGELNAPEYFLVLNKILCGWPLAETLPREITLTDGEQAEAEQLLEAVIQNWSVLKNTSIAGLRETFLQRKGKLSFQTDHNAWLLQVEHQAYDILLNQLPWGYAMIKHSWMPHLLKVEWG